MKLKDVLIIIAIYILLYLLGTALFVAFFSTPLLQNIHVFFYRGISLIIVSGIIVGVVMLILKMTMLKKLLVIRDILLMSCIFICVNMVLFTHLPVTAERSVSVFILGYMSENPDKSFTEQDIQNELEHTYVREYQAVDKRMQEQIVTGTIENNGTTYKITKRGKEIIKLYNLVADWFKLNKQLIHPK